ncbi:unnamed protein product [Protopolystoma xenopodis]|uniref:EF-hand domain-containing protein n=1 Tax=Protopolystoma xenopodis TaxID=117903 RepID=A0A3S5AR78_9PLAT|nr:unnamed protein product [Protopolystoma xenopodis]
MSKPPLFYVATTLCLNIIPSILLCQPEVGRQQQSGPCLQTGRIRRLISHLNHFGLWLIGFKMRPCPPDSSCCSGLWCSRRLAAEADSSAGGLVSVEELEQALKEQKHRMAKITSLHQSWSSRLLLNIGLVIIVGIAVTAFILFSLYFGQVPIGPIPVWHTDSVDLELNATLTHLAAYGVVRLVDAGEL